MNNIELIKFKDSQDNYKLMYKWCSNEYVYKWFEQRILSFNEIVTKYKNKLLQNKQELYIINYKKTPIGFVQIYKYSDKKYSCLEKYNNIYEYDIFIGESNYLSKGIGSLVVNYLNNYIYKYYKADCLILRPFKRNIRAVKCYQKNNYKIINKYIDIDTIGNKEEILVLINELK